jgi:hypothetical protein
MFCRWVGTFAAFVSHLGTFARGSMYGDGAHVFLVIWVLLALLFFAL